MPSSLRENAAKLARPDADGSEDSATPAPAAAVNGQAALPEPLPEVDIPSPGKEGPEEVPVHVAWSRVMETVRSVAKDERPSDGPKYNYRGVDTALNVFGPACRLHGVLVIPTRVQASYRDTTTSRGNATRECTAIVSYRIYGPAGDYIEAEAAGESLDSGDKGSAKAQAVALRTLLFHAGLVPTQDTDPDAHHIERGEAPVRPAASYRDEVLAPGTPRARMLQILNELQQHRMIGAVVQNEVGEEEPIGALVKRIGSERFGGGA